MSLYRGVMSKIDSIEKANGEGDPFAESFARLKAVESVAGLVANMAGREEGVSFTVSDPIVMESAYRDSFPMTQKRFDRGCDDLAVMAQTGAKALLQLNSAGRNRVDIAAQRLMREIQMTGRRTLDLLQK
ncbi:hypothetical protein GCM10009096_14240 [Parasphingorhabdus litoris]|uniref:Phasin domain-containing protein n=1 Tax=Parasphingorhabdus litoris TaxID=394733 RepID=A0ABP3K914_9SPHN|nr:hypothetical protein [Parasphingorhabdus litoris]